MLIHDEKNRKIPLSIPSWQTDLPWLIFALEPLEGIVALEFTISLPTQIARIDHAG
jgi:hypothetical protein